MVASRRRPGSTRRQDPQRPVFRAEVNLLRVDVQVVADDGQPIPNLELADFKVAIDGKPRRIVSAELVEYSQRSPDAVAPVVPIRTPGQGARRQPALHSRRRSARVLDGRAHGGPAGDPEVRRAAASRRHGRACTTSRSASR